MEENKKTLTGRVLDRITDFLIVILGNTLCALSVVLFLKPSGLITGGATGLALFADRMFGIPTSWFLLGFNVIMFLLGLLCFGKKFAAETALSTFVYPIAMYAAEYCCGSFVLTDDILLCTLFGGIGIGVSLGLVIRVGASTGGLDIPPLILQKYCHIPVAWGMWAFDISVLLMQAFFSDRKSVLYGVVLVILYSIVLDKVIVIGSQRMEVKIISEKNDEISMRIRERIDRGVTFLSARTGYLNRSAEMIFTVVSLRELARLRKLVFELDPDAFLVVTRTSEVGGRGFTVKKKYL